MSNLLGEYTVTINSNRIGSLSVSQNGLMTIFDCTCFFESSDVLRLAVVGENAYIPIGVMLPEGSELRLKKSFTKSKLAAIGLHEINDCTLIRSDEVFSTTPKHTPNPLPKYTPEQSYDKNLSHSSRHFSTQQTQRDNLMQNNIFGTKSNQKVDSERSWRLIEDPSALFSDPDLKEVSKNIAGALIREDGKTFHLAVPVSPNKPFPMMPVFCFGSLEIIDGESYIVFMIRNGTLTV